MRKGVKKEDSILFYFSFPKSKKGFEKWTFINVQFWKMENTFEKHGFFSASVIIML